MLVKDQPQPSESQTNGLSPGERKLQVSFLMLHYTYCCKDPHFTNLLMRAGSRLFWPIFFRNARAADWFCPSKN